MIENDFGLGQSFNNIIESLSHWGLILLWMDIGRLLMALLELGRFLMEEDLLLYYTKIFSSAANKDHKPEEPEEVNSLST